MFASTDSLLLSPTKTTLAFQGVNTPDSILQISCLTRKDREDLNYMLSIGVDWVALSFVQRPEDIVEIKRLIMEYNPNNAFPPRVMAKIEKPSVRFHCMFGFVHYSLQDKFTLFFLLSF